MLQMEAMSKQHARTQVAAHFGFRHGDRGTHSSRTMMFSELSVLLNAVDVTATKEDFRRLVVEDNLLGKKTIATRQASFQRLSELYSLDNNVPVFRVFQQFWGYSEEGQSLLACLCAAARDPLLRCTANAVLNVTTGDVVDKELIKEALREETRERFNDSSLDKIARNIASSWTQSGHLAGRSPKIRQSPAVTPANTAYALFLGYLESIRGPGLFDTPWTRMLATSTSTLSSMAKEASRRGWITYRGIGRVIDVTFPRLLTEEELELIREQG